MRLSFVTGGTSGTLSWIVGFPFDSLKSIVQAQNLNRPEGKLTMV